MIQCVKCEGTGSARSRVLTAEAAPGDAPCKGCGGTGSRPRSANQATALLSLDTDRDGAYFLPEAD